MLSIDGLKELGSFTGAPVEKEIEWTQKGVDHKATTYVRPLSYASAVSDIRAVGGGGDPIAGRIAACICDESGEPVFTIDDIQKGPPDGNGGYLGPLDGSLTMALLAAISEVTGLGETPAS